MRVNDENARRALDQCARRMSEFSKALDDIGVPPELLHVYDALPPHLQKAIWDDGYEYLLRTKQGDWVLFGGAEIVSEDWIHLSRLPCAYSSWPLEQYGLPFTQSLAEVIHVNERGMDIRISEIAAAFDHTS